MEYQKIINLLENRPNQPTKFRIKNLVEINDESRGTYNKNNQIRFKTSTLRTSLFDYSLAYISAKGTITFANNAAADAYANNANKKVIFKNCAPFTSCINRINNTQIDDVQYIDVVMLMYNLIEYIDNYSKTPGIIFQYCRDEPTTNINNNNIEFVDFTDANLTDLFKVKMKVKVKVKLTGQTDDNGTKNVEMMVPLKFPSNFWRTLEMPLINCEITLDLNWSEKCIMVATNIANQGATF